MSLPPKIRVPVFPWLTAPMAAEPGACVSLR